MNPFDLVTDQTLLSHFDLSKVLTHTDNLFANTDYQLEEHFIDFLEQNYGLALSNCWLKDNQNNEYQIQRILNYETKATLPKPHIPSWRGNIDLRLDFSVPLLAENYKNWAHHEQLLPFAALDCEDRINFDLLCLDYSYKKPAVVIWHSAESFGLTNITTTKITLSFKQFITTVYPKKSPSTFT